ncbi:hypothetical protein BDZ94DRAFT_1255962 [Collybia nuda]|uniref:Uncharacterized protein n=1 Tax=Collybia nuda TaxID=64659 RepID=A0A9P5Y730_9AGAR|nr:hypothetical protein BDZ94DRAFT_1255962 [Collybia nuda]
MLSFQFLTLGFIYYLSFFPLWVVSLKIISIPNISTTVIPASIDIEWLETSGDPPFVDIQIRCGKVPILQPPVHTKTSAHGCFIKDVEWNSGTFRGTCRVQLFDYGVLMAESPRFHAPEIFDGSPPSAGAQPNSTTHQTGPAPSISTTTILSVTTVLTSRAHKPSSIPIGPTNTIHTQISPGATISTATMTGGDIHRFSTVSSHRTFTTSTGSSIGTVVATPNHPTGSTSSATSFSIPVTSSVDGGEQNRNRTVNVRAAIIGGVLGGIVFSALLLGLNWVYVRRRRFRREWKEAEDRQIFFNDSESIRNLSP